jgi:hypothetical protein
MRRSINWVLRLGVAALALAMLTACPTEPVQTETLAEQVVNELGTTLSSSSRAASARALTAPQVSALKAAALAKITADGLLNSDELDKIFPSMMLGVQASIEANTAMAEAAKLAVLADTAESSIKSMGKTGRQNKLSAGVRLEQTVSIVARVAVQAAVAVAPTAADADLGVVTQAVAATVTVTASFQSVSTEALSQVVVGTMQATSGNSARNGLISKAVAAIITEAASEGSNPAAAVTELSTAVMAATSSDATMSALVVSASINAVMEASDTGNSAMVQAVIQGAVTVSGASAAETADQALMVITAASSAIAASESTEAAAIISSAITTATLVALNSGSELVLTDIQDAMDAGINDAGATTAPVVDLEEVTAVVNEEAPEFTLASSVEMVNALNTTVSLTATKTSASAVTWTWTQISGPTVTLTAVSDTEKSFIPVVSGEYVFTVNAKNTEGNRSATKTVKITASLASAASVARVEEGLTALADLDFDLAYTKFNAAYEADNLNVDAMFWSALLNISAVAVDSDTVALMKDRIGYLDYPETMNDLIAGTWISGTYYGVSNEFDPANFEYISSINLDNPISLPKLEVPEWAESLIGSSIEGERLAEGDLEEIITMATYPQLLMVNLVSRNPNGLNDMIDAVLAGPYGERLTTALELIEALPDSGYITVPADVIAAIASKMPTPTSEAPVSLGSDVSGLGDIPSSGDIPMPTIMIRKAELKAFSAIVQVSKSMVQLLASYNLNYPISFLQNEMWTKEGNATAMQDLFAQDNPFKAGFMSNRSDATRNAAKATMLAALSDYQEAVDLLLADVEVQGSLSSLGFAMIGSMNQGASSEEIFALVEVAATATKTLVRKLASAIENNTWLSINPQAANPADVVVGGIVENYISVNPGTLYSTDIFNPAKLLRMREVDGVVEGVQFYERVFVEETQKNTYLPFDFQNTETEERTVAICVELARMKEFIRLTDDDYIQFFSVKPGIATTSFQWRQDFDLEDDLPVMAWLSNQELPEPEVTPELPQ